MVSQDSQPLQHQPWMARLGSACPPQGLCVKQQVHPAPYAKGLMHLCKEHYVYALMQWPSSLYLLSQANRAHVLAPVHTRTHVCVDAQVEVNGGGEHGIPETATKAEANGQSPGPGAESGAEAKAEPEGKTDEAADFWAALQGKSPEQNGATAVSPSEEF